MIISNIKEVRDSRISEENLFSVAKRNVISLPDDVVESLNCYAWALGLTYPTNETVTYSPGFTSGYIFDSWQSFVENIVLDCVNLDIDFRISFEKPKELAEGEYLVKALYSEPSADFPTGEFHLIRQNPDTGIWYDKPGFPNQARVISNPSDDELFATKLKPGINVKYTPICYFVLR